MTTQANASNDGSVRVTQHIAPIDGLPSGVTDRSWVSRRGPIAIRLVVGLLGGQLDWQDRSQVGKQQ